MLTRELSDIFITTSLKYANLISLSFVMSASDAFDEVDGLASVFITESSSNGKENCNDDTNNLRDATGAFANNKFVEIGKKNPAK